MLSATSVNHVASLEAILRQYASKVTPKSFFFLIVLQLILCLSWQLFFTTFFFFFFFLNFLSFIDFSYLIPHFISPYPQDKTKVSFLLFHNLSSFLAQQHSSTARFPFEVEH